MDVIDLAEFYASPLGQMAKRIIRRQIRTLWSDMRALRMAGFGYATPFLRPFMGEAERVIALMPARQGVMHWPKGEPGLTSLVAETELPLPDASLDRMLLMHLVENSEELRPMLREVWRVLAPAGRVLVVVPNRRGLWARRESTPFGHGRPWSRGQVLNLLREALFAPTNLAGALSLPPLTWGVLLRSASAWERLGARYFPSFTGVVMVEAGKQIYAAPRHASAARDPLTVRAKVRTAGAGMKAFPATLPQKDI
jgi:SAM-dependent methyltransferase